MKPVAVRRRGLAGAVLRGPVGVGESLLAAWFSCFSFLWRSNCWKPVCRRCLVKRRQRQQGYGEWGVFYSFSLWVRFWAGPGRLPCYNRLA